MEEKDCSRNQTTDEEGERGKAGKERQESGKWDMRTKELARKT